jgi:lipopolysaccharide/colanic/teichoic acid biosynthesis glycosyltransferase
MAEMTATSPHYGVSTRSHAHLPPGVADDPAEITVRDLDALSAAHHSGGGDPDPAPVHLLTTYTAGRYERWVKPVVDRTGAAVLLLALLPLLLVAGLAILVTMGRPVMLRQQRIGRNGTPFWIYKFRTMEPDRRVRILPFVAKERRVRHKVPHDPRLTPVGRFLRKWSIDELPQLLNVLNGTMSLVGPRPEMTQIVDRYAPWQHHRHVVKPGVTGLWQVSARGDTPMHELTQIDLEYVHALSLWTDLKILLLTIPATLGLRQGF